MGKRLRIFKLFLKKKHEDLLYELLFFAKTTQTERNMSVRKTRVGAKIFSHFMKRMQKIPTGVEVRRSKLAGRPCLIASPDVPPTRDILYLHGGGWILGLKHLKYYRTFIAHIAKECQARVWALDYSLVPENNLETALQDCYNSYLELLQNGVSPSDLHMVGDSAGAGLSLAVMLKLRDEGVPLPRSAILLSPPTGANSESGSYIEKAEVDPFFSQDLVNFVKKTVFEGKIFHESPEAPLNQDLRGLPRLMIVVGGREILLDDSVQFAKKATEHGVDVTLDINDDAVHVYPTFIDVLPEARPALERMAIFLKASL